MANLTGKIGVVTGGGTGIGRATALAMAKAGAVVVIGNRDAGKGEEVVGLIRQAGGKAVFQKTDVSKPVDVQTLVARAVSEFGRLDLAFNNAGMDGEQVPLHEQDIEKASALFDVNIKGVFYCMKYEIEQMLKTGGGAIVNTSSIFGLNGYAGWSLYVAAKHAVTGMTKAAALDYAKKNVRINAVGPGPIETPLLHKGTGGRRCDRKNPVCNGYRMYSLITRPGLQVMITAGDGRLRDESEWLNEPAYLHGHT
jgi:NAD(P)-dependent dehydrogenase (short-subunit alcohol dehydrogenase family)